ncbi:hypothetical protein F2P81_005374 [Scophthalmus maximus]|uniref:Uncharacterized protein n=1 Tax=Scophthalmus maximus TaxID=52904 RepID=A0A6A4TIH7_SCOMX|nr:hypothetical protein F2P81_005374 [Scophthalmus maximus]
MSEISEASGELEGTCESICNSPPQEERSITRVTCTDAADQSLSGGRTCPDVQPLLNSFPPLTQYSAANRMPPGIRFGSNASLCGFTHKSER